MNASLLLEGSTNFTCAMNHSLTVGALLPTAYRLIAYHYLYRCDTSSLALSHPHTT